VLEIIEILKNHFMVACLTNTELEIAEIGRTTGLFEPFHKAFLSVEMRMQKPDHEIYKRVLVDLDCLPDEVIFIDDKQENVQAAHELGMQGILFKNVEQLRQDLAALNYRLFDGE
jgi:putative hydrolase of the HAD superfamily